VSLKVIHYLQNACTTETLQQFRCSVHQSSLCLIERKPDLVLHFLRETPQVFQRGADPEERLISGLTTHKRIMPDLACLSRDVSYRVMTVLPCGTEKVDAAFLKTFRMPVQ